MTSKEALETVNYYGDKYLERKSKMSRITHEQAKESLLQVYIFNDIKTNENNYVLVTEYIKQQEKQEQLELENDLKSIYDKKILGQRIEELQQTKYNLLQSITKLKKDFKVQANKLKKQEKLLKLYRKFFDLLDLKITDEEYYFYDGDERKTKKTPVLTNSLYGAWYDKKEIIDLFLEIKELKNE